MVTPHGRFRAKASLSPKLHPKVVSATHGWWKACDTLALRAHEQRSQQIIVTTQLAEGLPRILVDAQQIQQVLLNLTINAEQAMTSAHGRGSLAVRTRYAAGRRAVVIEIADDGPGIPAAVRHRIFDPFYTTKASGSGTGLGLTIARSILTEHGGHIRVESAATGTSFIIASSDVML